MLLNSAVHDFASWVGKFISGPIMPDGIILSFFLKYYQISEFYKSVPKSSCLQSYCENMHLLNMSCINILL